MDSPASILNYLLGHKFRFAADIRYRSILGLTLIHFSLSLFFYPSLFPFFPPPIMGEMGQPFCAFDFKRRDEIEEAEKKEEEAKGERTRVEKSDGKSSIGDAESLADDFRR